MATGDSVSLADLLQRARGNDPSVRERLFAACRNYLALIARAHVETWLQAKVDASDLIQQTLLEAYRDFPRFQGASEGELLAWLRQILTHNAANFVRQYRGTNKRQVSREVAVDQLAGNGSNPGMAGFAAANCETPSQELMRKEQELLLADALAQLPDDYREVIMLRNLQRMPFQDIAERMGRSRPAVQMLWGRAIEKLQQTFQTMKSLFVT
ncbi:MAG: sigma-70 family RNA polymerase sigma factor [Gemmataceae bacterium]|nr:sigma-70 family RNA polymerase sigma factor [Gemmataceae bacterium]